MEDLGPNRRPETHLRNPKGVRRGFVGSTLPRVKAIAAKLAALPMIIAKVPEPLRRSRNNNQELSPSGLRCRRPRRPGPQDPSTNRVLSSSAANASGVRDVPFSIRTAAASDHLLLPPNPGRSRRKLRSAPLARRRPPSPQIAERPISRRGGNGPPRGSGTRGRAGRIHYRH